MIVPDYIDIRKAYVRARSGCGSMSLGMIDKQSAHAEFNAFVQQERDKAANAARLEGMRAGWYEGTLRAWNLNGGPGSTLDGNPYE